MNRIPVCRPASGKDYDEFLALLKQEASEYLERSLELIGLTMWKFSKAIRTVGEVFRIECQSRPAGYYWIEKRGNVLHIHGIVLRPEFQGMGIAGSIMTLLAENYRGEVDLIELGVHDSNVRARELYQKLGYNVVKRMDEVGFDIMQKRLANPH
ncbi:MAG: GNAT family N-acetyltransferase [Candidatus Zixiibacteriota bacterium]|nr:MAG: GNAT family N-acetyltransferase [candidate division Zixibacteria bacterium]